MRMKKSMTKVVWVDSRSRVSGSDSSFEVHLRESLHLSEDTRVRVDKCCFVDSFLTTDQGFYVFFYPPGDGIAYITIPEGAYTGHSLAVAIQAASGRSTAYDFQTNSITHELASPSQQWLSDADLAVAVGT